MVIPCTPNKVTSLKLQVYAYFTGEFSSCPQEAEERKKNQELRKNVKFWENLKI